MHNHPAWDLVSIWAAPLTHATRLPLPDVNTADKTRNQIYDELTAVVATVGVVRDDDNA